MIDAELYTGLEGTAVPEEDDDFQEFWGHCVGIRNGLLQMRDQEDNVFEVYPWQVWWDND